MFSTTGESQAEKTKEMDEHPYEEADEQESSPLGINHTEVPGAKANQFDWALLATAVDRISFVSFSLAFLILAIRCSV